jgi:hypothetical protein
MEGTGRFYGHLIHFLAFGIFYGTLVYFEVNWLIFPFFGLLYQEKSGNPWTFERFKCLLECLNVRVASHTDRRTI